MQRRPTLLKKTCLKLQVFDPSAYQDLFASPFLSFGSKNINDHFSTPVILWGNHIQVLLIYNLVYVAKSILFEMNFIIIIFSFCTVYCFQCILNFFVSWIIKRHCGIYVPKFLVSCYQILNMYDFFSFLWLYSLSIQK